MRQHYGDSWKKPLREEDNPVLGLWKNGACASAVQGKEGSTCYDIVGKLKKRIDIKGLPSACQDKPQQKIASTGSLQHNTGEMFVDGIVEGKLRSLLVDTGATKTIIRPDIVRTSTKVTPTKWRLRTATGDLANIHGEADITFIIGTTSIKHKILVADIEDTFILGMDIMGLEGFELNFKHGTLKTNEKEVVLHRKQKEAVCVVLAADTSIPERSEVILNGSIDSKAGDGTVLKFEPRSHDTEIGKEVAGGKALIRVAEIVPVRMMNTNHYSVALKKGTTIGYCSPVSSIVRKMDAVNLRRFQKRSTPFYQLPPRT